MQEFGLMFCNLENLHFILSIAQLSNNIRKPKNSDEKREEKQFHIFGNAYLTEKEKNIEMKIRKRSSFEMVFLFVFHFVRAARRKRFLSFRGNFLMKLNILNSQLINLININDDRIGFKHHRIMAEQEPR